jgi:hypothetical protein
MNDTFWALLISPVAAVIISLGVTIFYQNRKQKLDAKHYLFRTLMTHRKADLPPWDAVNALNLIDVVFGDDREIVKLWHSYYSLLCSRPSNSQAIVHAYLDLLSGMATTLGYKSLKQTDMDKFYSPQGYADLAALNFETQLELLRVLKNTACFVVDEKKVEQISS